MLPLAQLILSTYLFLLSLSFSCTTMHRMVAEMAVAVAAPLPNNQTSALDTQLTQANFDTNMVIILAALLCSLICALGLNSLIRCFLRCTYRETAEQAAARVSATGVKKSALRKLPVDVYRAEGNKKLDTSTYPSYCIECPICLGDFIDGEKIRVLPKCNHKFHVECIDMWLKSHSSCPNCRLSVLETIGSSSKAAGGESLDHHGGSPPWGGGDRVGQHEHVVINVSGGS